jgi:methyl-accepting chemotaxis protein
MAEMTDDELRRLLQSGIEEMGHRVNSAVARIERQGDDLGQRFEVKSAEMREHFDATAADMRRHFDTTAERMESKFSALAETAQHLDEKLDRNTGLDEKIDRTAAETQAMIRFSHADLHRRFTTLETVTDLKQRVERLESSN